MSQSNQPAQTTSSRSWRLVWVVIAVAILVVCLSMAKSSSWWMPENISPGGEKIDHLFFLILAITGITFIITEGLLIYAMVKFRHQPGRKADHVHGHHRLETAWTIGTAAILLFLAIYQIPAWRQLKMQRPAADSAVKIQVLAEQFKFHFRYAGLDGKFETADDVMQIAELHVPVDKDVILTMRSKDVIHSLFLPHARFKQDVLPGNTIVSWFRTQKTTAAARTERDDDTFNYEIACAELCGNSHYTMRGIMVVHEQADFDKWLKKESTAAVNYAPPEVWEFWEKSVAKNVPAKAEH